MKSTGDGVLATFDGPGRAIRCAQAMSSGVHDLGSRYVLDYTPGNASFSGPTLVSSPCISRLAWLHGPEQTGIVSSK